MPRIHVLQKNTQINANFLLRLPSVSWRYIQQQQLALLVGSSMAFLIQFGLGWPKSSLLLK
jgi:hypothetical protein